MSHQKGNAKKVVFAALAGNLAIAVSKFIAAFLSGSTATLAEAVHSVADTSNQALLLLGMMLAAKEPNSVHQFGRAAERYFWPFVVALMLFSVGGTFAIYEGIHRLVVPETTFGSPWWSLGVLSVSFIFESFSFAVAIKEFKVERGNRGYLETIIDSRDPTIPLVLLEDASALTGLGIALVAVILSAVTGLPIFDSMGSIVIGCLLCGTAALLARETHSLLMGEAATPDVQKKVLQITRETPGVERVTQLKTMHHGPQHVILALKVAFPQEMHVEEVEKVTDEIERRIRAALPEMRSIFIEPDSRGNLAGITECDPLNPPDAV